MNASTTTVPTTCDPCVFELRFSSLYAQGRGFSFPCDAAGCVPMDCLSERARNNYFYARALTGRDLAYPVVQRAAH